MKLKEGDVFSIPVDDETVGFGQIINIPNKNNFIIIVFKNIFNKRSLPKIENIIKDEILFWGYTMDAKLYHKHWRIIGNDSSNIINVKLPYYKLGTPPECKLVDYKGTFLKKISPTVFHQLPYQEVIAPVRYENALKAYYKLIEWRQDYDELFYKNVLNSIKVVHG